MDISKLPFVLVATGKDHLGRVQRCINSFRMFCPESPIILLTDREFSSAADQTIVVTLSEKYDLSQRSRLIKTNLLSHLPDWVQQGCYIDTDAFPVSENAQQIIQHFTPPVTFADDHFSTPFKFGKWTLHESHPVYPDLTMAIEQDFQLTVDPEWRLWNGGVFVFDRSAEDFFNTWYEMTKFVIDSPDWKTRDQGSLVATVWRMNLQNHPRLPLRCNWLVRHSGHYGSELNFENDRFFFNGERIDILHFIDGHGSGYESDIWEWHECMRVAGND